MIARCVGADGDAKVGPVPRWFGGVGHVLIRADVDKNDIDKT